jgi:hypothetical protein
MKGRLHRAVGGAIAGLVMLAAEPSAVASTSPRAPIKVRVMLRTQRVAAGDPIRGSVVLTNTTRTTITVDTCALDGWLAVGLHGKVDSYPFGGFEVACPPTVRLAPGANRFPVTVSTSSAGCTQPSPGGSPSSLTPACTESDGHVSQPPLPAGRYATELSIAGLPGLTRLPNRIVVTLTPPARALVSPPCTETPSSVPHGVTVPDVVGASSSTAALVFASACLNARYADPVGTRVRGESPPAGTTVPEFSTVTLSTS